MLFLATKPFNKVKCGTYMVLSLGTTVRFSLYLLLFFFFTEFVEPTPTRGSNYTIPYPKCGQQKENFATLLVGLTVHGVGLLPSNRTLIRVCVLWVRQLEVSP